MSSSIGTTPGRKLRVTIDTPHWRFKQHPFYTNYRAWQIAPNDGEHVSNMQLIPGVGWTLEHYQRLAHVHHEWDVADKGVFYPGSATKSATTVLNVKPSQRFHSELPGVNQGYQRTNGGMMLTKEPGDSYDVRDATMLADEAAFPKPDCEVETTDVDRVFISDGLHHPSEAIIFTWTLPPTSGLQSLDKPNRIYFSGIAGTTWQDVYLWDRYGLGDYSLSFGGDGIATLCERCRLTTGTFIWVQRGQFRATPARGTFGGVHTVEIRSDARSDGKGGWIGSKILFNFDNGSGSLISTLSNLAQMMLGGRDQTQWQVYDVPQFEKHPTVLQPLRADMRRDVLADIQFAQTVYKPTGILKTNVFAIPGPLEADAVVTLNLMGSIPAGTSLELELYSIEASALIPQIGYVANKWGVTAQFQTTTDRRHYYAVITSHSSTDGWEAPSFDYLAVGVPITYKLDTPTPLVLSKVTEVSMTGPSSDPSHETMAVTVEDDYGNATRILQRNALSIRADVLYDESDATKYSTLFIGRVSENPGTKRGRSRLRRGFNQSAPSSYPSANWYRYNLTAVGEWCRLMEAQSPQRWDWSRDPATGSDSSTWKPYKVTDALRTLFESRYPPGMIDVPDFDRRFFVGGDDDQVIIEATSPIGPPIITWASMYFGAYIISDPNATNSGDPDDPYGCWRLRVPPKPPYRPICQFLSDQPSITVAEGVLIPSLSPARYPDIEIDGRTIPQTMVLDRIVNRCEAPWNKIVVRGATSAPTSATMQASAGGSKVACERTLCNYKSTLFYDGQGDDGIHPAPDPEDPDYCADQRILYCADPALVNQSAVDLMAFRLYDLCAHTKLWRSFSAPALLVWDPDDPLQVRPRLPRFGDIVLLDGEVFVVWDCNLLTRSGRAKTMHCHYELFKAPALSDYSGLLAGRVVGDPN